MTLVSSTFFVPSDCSCSNRSVNVPGPGERNREVVIHSFMTQSPRGTVPFGVGQKAGKAVASGGWLLKLGSSTPSSESPKASFVPGLVTVTVNGVISSLGDNGMVIEPSCTSEMYGVRGRGLAAAAASAASGNFAAGAVGGTSRAQPATASAMNASKQAGEVRRFGGI